MKAVISFTGDIMCAPGLTELCTENGVRDYTETLIQLQEVFDSCDCLCGNLETPIAGEGLTFTHERYCFNSPDEFAVMLKERGFDLLCLANNHCMDRGEEGIYRTLDTLDRLGFERTGIQRPGEKRYTVSDINGIKVGFVNYTYGTNAFAHHIFLKDELSGLVNLFQPQETLPGSIHLLESEEKIASETKRLYSSPSPEFDRYIKPHLDMLEADIKAAKAESDFVIMIMHSGGQYNRTPDPYTKMLVGRLRALGVDLIVGHHPHILHGFEVKDGILCAYSLGNLCCIPSITQNPEAAANSAILRVTLEKEFGAAKLTKADLTYVETVGETGGIPYCRVKGKADLI